MYNFQQARPARSLALATLGAVLTVGLAGAGFAGASLDHRSSNGTTNQGDFLKFFGHDGHGHGHGHGHEQFGLRGQVTAVSATSVTIQGEKGTSVVLTITPTTTFSVGGTTTTASSLVIGERVQASVSPTAPSVATQIKIQLMRVEGVVNTVTSSSLTLSKGDGQAFTVTVSPATTFTASGAATTISSVVAGVRVEVQGVMSIDHTTFAAMNVTILNAGHSGNSHENGNARRH